MKHYRVTRCALVALILAILPIVRAQSNAVLREVFLDIGSGVTVADLTGSAKFIANAPDEASLLTSLFEAPTDVLDNYGQRLRALITAPVTGQYTFWIASDDASDLYLSTDANPANKTRIAYVALWTASREWTKEANQQSAPLFLTAGQRYYIEALMKEGTGGDNLAVRWLRPGGVDEAPINLTNCVPYGKPLITAQPAHVAVAVGGPAAFSVSAIGSAPLSYQWRKNGSPIPGAVNSTLTFSNVFLSDSGGYSCSVGNALGSVISQAASLTVLSDVTQPGDPIVPSSSNSPGSEGVGNAIDNQPTKYLNFDAVNTGFTVTPSSGSSVVQALALTSANDAPDRDPASFRLEGSNNGSNFVVIASNSVPVFSTRFERVVISFANNTPFSIYRLIFPITVGPSPCCMQIAEVEFLAALGPPTITSQPSSRTVTNGNNATFSVTAIGTPPLSYQWSFNGANLSGRTNASLTIVNAGPTNAGIYTVVVANSAGSITSAVATLTVLVANTFIQSAPITINDNAAATPYPSTIFVSGVVGMVFKVTVTLSNISHTFPSDLDVLLVGPNGQSVMLMSSAGGGSAITNAVLTFDDTAAQAISTGTQITNGTFRPADLGSATLPPPAPGPPGGGRPYNTNLSVFNGFNPNGTWQLFVNDHALADVGSMGSWRLDLAAGMLVPPSISAQPQSLTVTNGSNAAFDVSATGTAPLAYQWRFNGSNLGGQTNSTLTIFSAAPANEGNYTVVIANSAGFTTSAVATLTVLVPPSDRDQLPNSLNIGQNKVGAVSYEGNGSYTIVGGGNDIGDQRDEFTYAYTEVTGDFDVQVRVESLTANAPSAKAGIMARESLSEYSRMAFARVTPDQAPGLNNRLFAYRTGLDNVAGVNGGLHEDGGPLTSGLPNGWMRLVRIGNTVSMLNSADGVTWNFSASQDTTNWGGGALSSKLFVGLGVSRHSGAALTTTAVFRQFQFNSTGAAPFAVVGAESRGNPNGVRVLFNNPVGAGAFVPGNYVLTTLLEMNVTRVTGVRFTTANDAPERDPLTYTLEGTTDDPAVGSWELIASGATGLAADPGRNTAGPTVNFANANSYRSYRLLFPTIRDAASADSMQIAEIELLDAGGVDVTEPTDTVVGVSAIAGSSVSEVAVAGTTVGVNNYPPAEYPALAFDNSAGTKYLNFAKINTGVIITSSGGVQPGTPVGVTAVGAGPNANTVQLTTSQLVVGASYGLQVANVLAANGTSLTSGNASFTHGDGYEAQRIHVTHNKTDDSGYYRISDATAKSIGDVTALGGGVFPPSEGNNVFEDPIPDLGTNERFSTSIYGVLNPTATGNHIFYMSSDDAGRLYLSTDANPANKVQIASEPAWNGIREYIAGGNQASRGVPPANISAPIALQAGGKYYMELSFTEGGGGNNGSATWLPPGGAAVMNGSSPIPEQFFVPSRLRDGNYYTTLGPVRIISQPAAQTVVALAPVTFNVGLDGTPGYTYQWRRNGVVIPGANSRSYTILAAQLTDDQAVFRVDVANEFSSATSSNAILTVQPPTPPHLIAASADGTFTRVTVSFDNRLELASAQNPANYAISGGVAISGATRDATARRVVLQTSPLTSGTSYTLTVRDIRDETGATTLVPNPSTTNFTGWVFSRGVALMEVYPTGGGVAVSILTTHPSYPNSPSETYSITHIDSRDAYPNDSHADYGARISGLFVPLVTGNQIFYLRSDDASELWLSTDSNPANKVKIQEETSCCNAFTAHASTPIPLVAGNRYYFELIWKEGGGGDFGQASMDGTNPVPGRYLGVFGNPDLVNLVITQQPQSITRTVNGFGAFTVGASLTSFDGVARSVYYQWRLNGADIPGANSASYVTPQLTVANDGEVYSVEVNTLGASLTSAVATLTVLVPPSISTQPVSRTVTNGNNAVFSVSAIGTAPLAYQWRFNGGNLSGQTNASLTIFSAAPANEGNYTVVIANSAGVITSAVATLTVLVPPSISTQPASLTVTNGSNAVFSVSAAGTAPLTYQWRFNGNNLAGQTSASLTIFSAAPANEGNYTVVIANGAGSITSAVATLTVLVPPSISAQPQSLTVTNGSNAVFSVSANGTAPLAYQWRFNGGNLAGQTSATLTILSAAPANEGNYTVVIANGAGSITSAVATLTVLVPPSIGAQPQSLTVTNGSNAVFSVSANGTAPLAYQWRFNGGNLAGQTSATLTILSAAPANEGGYTVVIANGAGSITSAVATLTVLVPPSIGAQPSSLIVTQGQSASFSVSANGTAPLAYQWRFNGNNLSGQTSAALTINNAAPANEGNYTVVIANGAGSITSAVATLTVLVPPSIGGQPQSLTVTNGSNAVFSVSANGTAPLAYQWRFNGNNLSGQTSAALTINNAAPANEGNYTVVIANGAGSITSAVATLTVLVPPSIGGQPQSLTVTNGSNAVFSVSANGTAPLAYQWRFNGNNLAGQTSASLTIFSAAPANEGNYTVVIANSAGVITSAVATLTVLVPPSISAQPASLTVTNGSNAVFSVSANGTAPLAYQWRFNGGNLAGQTSASLTIFSAASANEGNYTVVIANSAGVITSAVATLTVLVPPSISAQPQSLTVTNGSNAVFSVSANGTAPLAYQWRFNGGNLAGQTSASLTIFSAASANEGNYTVVIANSAGVITSAVATLTVLVPPSISAQPQSLTVTNGSNAVFSVSANGTVPFAYQWRFNGGNLAGQTSASLTIFSAAPANEGNYTVVIANGAGSITSAVATLTVLVPPSISAQPASLTVTNGSNAVFSVSANGTAPLAYQWRFNGGNLAGQTSASLTIFSAASANEGNYTVVIANSAGVITSAVATLTVLVPPSISAQPQSLTVTNGSNAVLSVSANGTAPLAYQWRFNGNNLAGQTSASLTIFSAAPANEGNYTVVIANGAGSITSAVATLTVLVPPSISAQPQSLTVTNGSNAVLSVSANGTAPLAYQWRFNGNNLAGQTSASLTIFSAAPANEGNYTVVIANGAGSITSAVATLTVLVPPSISAQPSSLTVTQGQSASFSVSANGTSPLTYQWRFNGNNLSGQTSAALTINNAAPANEGNYTVVIANGAGSITSAVATLTVLVPPSISAQPASLTVTNGSNAVFSVSANGTAPLAYQWRFNGANLAGQTSASLTIFSAAPANEGNYTVVIANSAGSTTSAVATLTVLVPPSITAQPASLTVTNGGSAVFSVTATGTAPLAYQWRFNGGDLVGQTSASLTINSTAPANAGGYSVVIANAAGSVTSAVATLTVVAQAAVLESYSLDLPAGYSLIANQLHQGNSRISAVLPNLPNGTTLLKWNGAIQAFIVETYLAGLGWQPGTMTLVPGEGAFINLPSPQTLVFAGEVRPATLPLTLFAGYNLVSRQIPRPGTFEEITGRSPEEGVIVDQYRPATGDYRTQVFLDGEWRDRVPAAQVGEAVWVSQFTRPNITGQPAPQTNVTPGSTINFAVAVTGTPPLRYQWQRNGVSISDATNASYTINNAQILDSGTYTVAVQPGRLTPPTPQPGQPEDLPGAVISAPAALRFVTTDFPFSDDFGARPVVNTFATTLTGNNSAATLEPGEPRHAGKPGGHSVWLAWMAPANGVVTFFTLGSSFDTLLAAYSGNGFPGAEVESDDDGGPFLSSRITFNATAGQIYNLAVDGFAGGSRNFVLSWSLETTTERMPTILTQPQNHLVSFNGSAEFRVEANGANLTYQWFRDGQAVNGATSSNLVISPVRDSDVGVYFVQINSGSRFVFSHPVLLQISSAGENGLFGQDKFQDIVVATTNSALVALPGKAVRKAVAHGFSGTEIKSSIGSVKQEDEPNHCGLRGGKSEWFAYQPTNHGTLKVDTDGSNFDTVLAVYVGPGDGFLTLTNVACDNNSGANGRTSSVLFNVTSNTIYYIAVDGVNHPVTGVAASGSIHLNYRLVLPLTLTSLSYSPSNANGRVVFKVNGTPNVPATVQSASSLSAPVWTSLFTNTSANGTFNYTNTNALSFTNRFYRAINRL